MVKFKRMVVLYLLIISMHNLFAETPASEPSQLPTVPYRLFKTANMWTFIKLDTATGKMWQLQFDIQGDNRGTVVLNSQDLCLNRERKPGRFTLYPTTNIFTFILVDQFDGRTWQVQWSLDGNRMVIPIE